MLLEPMNYNKACRYHTNRHRDQPEPEEELQRREISESAENIQRTIDKELEEARNNT